MAGLSEYGDGLKRIGFNLEANGARQFIRLGAVDRRTAEEARLRIGKLIAAKQLNISIDPETAAWLAHTSEELHRRIAATGLVPPRQKAAVVTVEQLTGRFEAMVSSTSKPETQLFYGHTLRNLKDFFTPSKALETITAADADTYRGWLQNNQGLSLATVNRRVIAAKTVFQRAVRWDLLVKNPFEDVRGGSQVNEARKAFVPPADIAKVLEACPDTEWRCLVALSRYGGLRMPSEAVGLTWQDVDWDKGVLHVRSPKTEHHAGGGSRFVPLFPELRTALMEAFELAEEGETHVVPRCRDGKVNLRTTFEKIIRRAGLTPWPRLWHSMRASRQSELMAEYSLTTACRWLGNSPAVAAQHYAMTINRDADLQRAIVAAAPPEPGAPKGAPSAHQKAHQQGRALVCGVVPDDKKTLDNSGFSHSDAQTDTLTHVDKMGVVGLEPTTLRV